MPPNSHHRPSTPHTRAPQEALAEAGSLRLASDALRLERDVFVYRSYVGSAQYA